MRSLIALVLLAVASALAPHSASAQTGVIPWEDDDKVLKTLKRPAKGEWMFGVDIGFANNLQAEFDERGTRFVVVAERNIAPWLGAQADFNCSRGVERATMTRPEWAITSCTAAVNAVVPIPVTTSIWPYVRVGIGHTFWDRQSTEGFVDLDEDSPAYVVGFGTRIFPMRSDLFALRLDAQRLQTSLFDLDVTQWSFGLGVTWRFPQRD